MRVEKGTEIQLRTEAVQHKEDAADHDNAQQNPLSRGRGTLTHNSALGIYFLPPTCYQSDPTERWGSIKCINRCGCSMLDYRYATHVVTATRPCAQKVRPTALLLKQNKPPANVY